MTDVVDLTDLGARYRRDGFVSPIRIIDTDEAAVHRDRMEAAEAQIGPVHYQDKMHLVLTSTWELATHPRVLDAVEACIGPDILLYNSMYVIKEPRSATKVNWHQDLTFWGLSDDDAQVTAWLALSPATVESGCMQMVPGSHLGGRVDHVTPDQRAADDVLDFGQYIDGVDLDAARHVPLQMGEMSLHHGWTVHSSMPNRSDDRRIGFNAQYLAPHCRQVMHDLDTAVLVRGVDEYGHFGPETARDHRPRPRRDRASAGGPSPDRRELRRGPEPLIEQGCAGLRFDRLRPTLRAMQAHGLNPRIRKSPFFASTLKYGATEFHPYNGMWMPVGYDTPVNEYWNVIERASLWDVAVQRCVEIAGPDAEAFMNLLTPRDVSKVAVGQCRYVVMTNQEGGVLNDPVMLRMAPDRFWLSTADSDMYLWAKGVSAFSGHDVEVTTPHVYPLQLQGPNSPKIMASVLGDEILDLAYYRWMHGSVDGIEVVISRTGYSSEVGFEIYLLGQERGDDLWELLMAAGEPHEISPGSPNRIRRIEGGVLDYGSDITPDENPLELGLDRLVAWDKADFLGKAALERIRDEGVRRRQIGVFMDGAPFLKNNEHRWSVVSGGAQVGIVTSAVHSPRLERNIGFALVDVPFDSNDAPLTVETAEGVRAAERTETPFVRSPAAKTAPLR